MENSVVATVEEESKDWINELPDCILSYIFSLLTIKDAVDSTSIVCRRWRNLWKTRSPNLELDIANIFGSKFAEFSEEYERYPFEGDSSRDLGRYYIKRRSYIIRVEKVLELLSCNKLDSFRVAFWLDRSYTNLLDKWVRFAIAKGAQKPDLHLSRGPQLCNHLYVFPHGILADLNVSTLTHLSLSKCVLKPPTDFDKFVQLTTLFLRYVEVGPRFMSHLFSACSLLESLTLKWCKMGSDLIIGPSVHLHDLKVLDCSSSTAEDPRIRIKIDAVNLSSLEYSGHKDEILMRTPKLVTFFVRDLDPLPNVLTQLTSCPGLNTLHLQIRYDGKFKPQNFSPTFKNLKQLKLDVLNVEIKFARVLNIIRVASVLEELVMTLKEPYGDEDVKNLSTFSHDYLRRVTMQAIQGSWFKIDMAICILKIATRLELLVIDPFGSFYTGDGEWCDISSLYTPVELWYRPERGITPVQEILKEVKTDAKVIIISDDKA